MAYTYQEIINKCQDAFQNVKTFYQADVVNYRGRTSDTNEYYSEVVAKFILDNIDVFRTAIPVIMRKSSYKIKSHNHVSLKDSNRVEEIVAKNMFMQSENGYEYDFIGKIIDYQTPLKSKKEDVAGKIDLLSYDGYILRILELKKSDSEETMLRCVLEGYTYMMTVDDKKLLVDWNLPEDTLVKASPFVFLNGIQYQEMQEERKWLKKLMCELDSVPYYIVENNEKYYVTEA